MTAFYGGDTDQLRLWGDTAGSAHGALADLFVSCSSQMDQVQWVGPDADRFQVSFRTVLSQWASAVQRLEDFARDAVTEAEEQDRASDSDGTGESPFPPHGGTGGTRNPGPHPGWDALSSALVRDISIDPFGALEEASSAWDRMHGGFGFIVDTISSLLGTGREVYAQQAARIEKHLDTAKRYADESIAEARKEAKAASKFAGNFRKMLRPFGAAGLAIDAATLGEAMVQGRTGDALGKFSQIAFELSPPGRIAGIADGALGAIGAATGFKVNAFGQELDFSANSPMDLAFQGLGNLSTRYDPLVRADIAHGEQMATGLGASPGSTASNLIVTGNVIASRFNPATSIGAAIGQPIGRVISGGRG
ncbi:hypothetical protein ACT3SP_05710 [Brachybacterium sp. AOP43-C2-M15]|uniref:hypothetical protein n=1 Tax=Brachybacterium sp. AOP43-C2-M15 TaxID=3457661 RepID=UPI004034D89D